MAEDWMQQDELRRYLNALEDAVKGTVGPFAREAELSAASPQLGSSPREASFGQPDVFAGTASSRKRGLSSKRSLSTVKKPAEAVPSSPAPPREGIDLDEACCAVVQESLHFLLEVRMLEDAIRDARGAPLPPWWETLEAAAAALPSSHSVYFESILLEALGEARAALPEHTMPLTSPLADPRAKLLETSTTFHKKVVEVLFPPGEVARAAAPTTLSNATQTSEADFQEAYTRAAFSSLPHSDVLLDSSGEAWDAIARNKALLHAVLSHSILPFHGVLPCEAGAVAGKPFTNQARLEQLLAAHRRGTDGMSEFGVASYGALRLLARFVKTSRFPVDFRAGVAPEADRFVHDDDPLLGAWPCVYAPRDERPPDEQDRSSAEQLRHAWLFVTARGLYLLADASISDERHRKHDRERYAARLSGDALSRKLDKKAKERKAAREDADPQMRDDCMLLPVVQEWSEALLTVDLTPSSDAFLTRMVQGGRPPALLGMRPPPVDQLLDLHHAVDREIDPMELSDQRYRCAVLRSISLAAAGSADSLTAAASAVKSEVSIIFPSDTSRDSLLSLLWVWTHREGRSNERTFVLHQLPKLLGVSLSAPMRKGKPQRATVNGRVDVVQTYCSGLGSSARGCPAIGFSKPLLLGSMSEWYPFHLHLRDEEVQLCQQFHVHPAVYLETKSALVHNPHCRCTSLFDVATLLMAASDSEDLCMPVAEAVMELFVSLGWYAPVEVAVRGGAAATTPLPQA